VRSLRLFHRPYFYQHIRIPRLACIGVCFLFKPFPSTPNGVSGREPQRGGLTAFLPRLTCIGVCRRMYQLGERDINIGSTLFARCGINFSQSLSYLKALARNLVLATGAYFLVSYFAVYLDCSPFLC